MMSAGAAGKRKRGKSLPGESLGKAEKGSDEDTGASGSDVPRAPSTQLPQAPQSIVDLKKRTKTVGFRGRPLNYCAHPTDLLATRVRLMSIS